MEAGSYGNPKLSVRGSKKRRSCGEIRWAILPCHSLVPASAWKDVVCAVSPMRFVYHNGIQARTRTSTFLKVSFEGDVCYEIARKHRSSRSFRAWWYDIDSRDASFFLNWVRQKVEWRMWWHFLFFDAGSSKVVQQAKFVSRRVDSSANDQKARLLEAPKNQHVSSCTYPSQK